jgi:hypothetical protein
MITEADLLAHFTLNDAIMSMIYCLVASNGIESSSRTTHGYVNGTYLEICQCCEVAIRSEASPYISFRGARTEIYKSWLELAEILTLTSRKVEHAREFSAALGIRSKLTKDTSEHINMQIFNRNLQKLEVASEIAEETHNQVNKTQGNLETMLSRINPYRGHSSNCN